MTVEIDFDEGTYSGVTLGKSFKDDLELVKESPEVVVFKADDDEITAQFQDNGEVILRKEGGIPVELEPAD